LRSSTQQKIVKVINRAWSDLAPTLGRDRLTYSEGFQLFLQYFGPGKIPISFLSHVGANGLPPTAPTTGQDFDLSLIDTQEKFEAFLLSQPEPSSQQLEVLVK
jgi:hypothetical protein